MDRQPCSDYLSSDLKASNANDLIPHTLYMTPLKTLISILSLFLTLGLLASLYPSDGIRLGESKVLRFPSLTEIFPEADTTESKGKLDPEDEIKAMMNATSHKEFAAFTDSLLYYEDFFDTGKTRFDLPGNDPTWFDRFFLHLQLAELDSSVVHVVHYGDSQLEEDRISSTIREDLQSEFGGTGPGMLPAILKVPSQTTSHWNSGDLQRYIVFGPKDEQATHNRYGPLAQFSSLSGSAIIKINRRPDRKNDFSHVGGYSTIKILASRKGRMSLKLTYERTYIDSVGLNPDSTIKEKRTKKIEDAGVPTIDSLTQLKVYTWKLPDTTSSMKLYLSGYTDIYAISVEGKYGVAVDNVAMRGSSGTIFNKMDEELLAESYKAINAKLIIMEYGGNMVPSISSKNIERTKKLVTAQIQTIQKANPEADILFIGPADMAKQIDGKWQTYPALNMTIEALREVALENGAAFWDMHRVMGGDGSMIKWVKKQPSLGFTDHIHFTRRGATHMGDLFCSALRMYYDYFKFRDQHKLTDETLAKIHALTNKTQDTANIAANVKASDAKSKEIEELTKRLIDSSKMAEEKGKSENKLVAKTTSQKKTSTDSIITKATSTKNIEVAKETPKADVQGEKKQESPKTYSMKKSDTASVDTVAKKSKKSYSKKAIASTGDEDSEQPVKAYKKSYPKKAIATMAIEDDSEPQTKTYKKSYSKKKNVEETNDYSSDETSTEVAETKPKKYSRRKAKKKTDESAYENNSDDTSVTEGDSETKTYSKKKYSSKKKKYNSKKKKKKTKQNKKRKKV